MPDSSMIKIMRTVKTKKGCTLNDLPLIKEYFEVDNENASIIRKYIYPILELIRLRLIEAYDDDNLIDYERAKQSSEQQMKNWRFFISPQAVDIELALDVNLSGEQKSIYGPPTKYPFKSDVFVLMPFSLEMQPIFQNHVKVITEELHLSCKRADDLFTNGMIINEIWSSIYFSSIIIADCTGRNPNVFYEIGIAHTLGKETILITQSMEDIPFDVRHLRIIKYDNNLQGMIMFDERLRKTIIGIQDLVKKKYI